MKLLLIYPKFPDTFWSSTFALGFIGKKAAFPPLGLPTMAALLPEEWPRRLVDVNVDNLSDKEQFHYWQLMLWTLVTKPRLMSVAITD